MKKNDYKKVEVLIPFVPEWTEDGEKRGFHYRDWHTGVNGTSSVENVCQICHARDVIELPKDYAARCVKANMVRYAPESAKVTRVPLHYRFKDEPNGESGQEKPSTVPAEA